MPHATTGLLAWLLASLLSGGAPAPSADDAEETPGDLLSLGLDREGAPADGLAPADARDVQPPGAGAPRPGRGAQTRRRS